jgi:hypothetical protein
MDGFEIRVGDNIWVWQSLLKKLTEHKVAEVCPKKVLYTEPCPETGYIGARFNLVYKCKENFSEFSEKN